MQYRTQSSEPTRRRTFNKFLSALGAALVVSATQASATAIISFENGSGQALLSETSIFASAGFYSTGLDYQGLLAGRPDVPANARIELSGVQLLGDPIQSGSLNVATTGGSFRLFDADQELLLDASIGSGALSEQNGGFVFESADLGVFSGSIAAQFFSGVMLSLEHSGGLVQEFREITELVQTGTERVKVGEEQVQVGTERKQVGTERKQVGTERKQVGTERKQVGTERKQVGTEQVQVGTRFEIRIIDGKPVQVAVPIYEQRPVFRDVPVYADVAVYAEVPVFADVPVYADVPVFETKDIFAEKPIFTEITKHIPVGFSFEAAFLGGSIRGSEIPEPSTAVLFGLGSAAVLRRRRKLRSETIR